VSEPVQVSDVDYIVIGDDAHEVVHQGTCHSRFGDAPGPPPPPPAAPRPVVREIQGPRRTKRIPAG